MKLVHPRLETAFDKQNINVLVVERAVAFRELCLDLQNAAMGIDDRFVLSDGDKAINIANKGLVISNPLESDVNDKKILNKLYSVLVGISDEELSTEAANIRESFSEFFDKLNAVSPLQIDWFNESPTAAILKAFGVVIKNEYESYTEKLINYLAAAIELNGIKFIAFINLKSYFCENELKEIYKFLRYNDIFVFLLESSVKNKFDDEFRVIIDDDLCEIIA